MKLLRYFGNLLLSWALICIGVLGSLLCVISAFTLPTPPSLWILVPALALIFCLLVQGKPGKFYALGLLDFSILLGQGTNEAVWNMVREMISAFNSQIVLDTPHFSALVFCIRLMGKRQVGEMEPAEFVVTMLLANLAAGPMQDGALPLLSALLPILTVLGLELVLAVLSMKSELMSRLLCGKPEILIKDGRIDQKVLSRNRMSMDELNEQLREKDDAGTGLRCRADKG